MLFNSVIVRGIMKRDINNSRLLGKFGLRKLRAGVAFLAALSLSSISAADYSAHPEAEAFITNFRARNW
jgi:hypothetical protein